jgi:hypothetical protein
MIQSPEHFFRLMLSTPSGPGCDITVHWRECAGGSVDAGTGAVVGGETTPRRGTLRALAHEEPARGVLRQYAEITAGDLILDILPDAVVQVTANGVKEEILFDTVAAFQPTFEWQGRFYQAKETGKVPQCNLDAVVGGRVVIRTLVLRRAT